jgi:hypothetical protein
MLMWLSFVRDGKFAGVVITEAMDVADAASKCWRIGVNPGGEIMSFQIPEDAAKERSYPRDTLLSEDFLKADGHKKIKDCPPDVQKALGVDD